MHSCHHTALSEISNRIVGVHITTNYQLFCTILLPMWGLQILLFGLKDRPVSTEDDATWWEAMITILCPCQIGEDCQGSRVRIRIKDVFIGLKEFVSHMMMTLSHIQ